MQRNELELNVFHCSAVISSFEKVGACGVKIDKSFKGISKVLCSMFEKELRETDLRQVSDWQAALSMLSGV